MHATSCKLLAPEAAAVVVHAAARAAHLGARSFGGEQVREGGGVRVAAAVLPRQLAPRCKRAPRGGTRQGGARASASVPMPLAIDDLGKLICGSKLVLAPQIAL